MSTTIRILTLVLAVALARSKNKNLSSIHTEGDIILGGLFPVHEKGPDENTCGSINLERGIQRLEAMRFAVKDINDNPRLLQGLQLGVQIFDTCSDATHALDQSLDFVMSTLNQADHCVKVKDSTDQETKPQPIMAVVGGAYSAVSLQIANLLRLFEIPQISYASTSEELSDKERFGYFMRTVPPDKLQARALADIVERLNWKYVSTVASEGEYGESGITAFQKNFEKQGQCLAAQLKISRTPTESEFKDVVKSLYKKLNVKVVVLFLEQDHAVGVLSAARSLGLDNYFIWLASDGWGDAMKVVNGNERVANGALTITLQSKDLKPFDRYFLGLTPQNNVKNVWFKEYWQEVHGCWFNDSQAATLHHNISSHFPEDTYKPVASQSSNTKVCTGDERQEKFLQESKIQFVYDAIYAVAVALDRLYRETCGENATSLCSSMNSNNAARTKLLRYIRENRSPESAESAESEGARTILDPYGNAIRFDESGDSLGYYDVMNYRYNEEKKRYEYAVVGTWEDNHLELPIEEIVWPGPRLPDVPRSMCSVECTLGSRKDVNDENACCWSCIPCSDHQYLIDESTCKDCETGQWPNANRSACYELELQHIRWSSPFAIIPALLSFIGLVVTTAVVVLFVLHKDTPVVKAAGRELSFMLLIGCLVCYGSVFILLIKPSQIACLFQRFFMGAGFAIIYSSLLVKTNRIYRIFTSASKTTKRPAFISPKSQIIIATLLASAQVLVYIIWLILEPPGTRTDTPNINDKANVVLKCSSKESSLLISLIYNMLLIVVCTVYAVLTRKIPSSFNESKFIGFTMYTTCIIWLSFVPIYFGLKSSFQIQVTTLCTAVFLSSTVAFLCLFGPKVHIILFQPHKNTRKATTERQRFSANLKLNKTETDYVAESPNRSRTSSFTCSPFHNANSTSPRKCAAYELRNAAIPEEMTNSLLVEKDKDSSSDSALSTECDKLRLSNSLKPCIKYSDQQEQIIPKSQIMLPEPDHMSDDNQSQSQTEDSPPASTTFGKPDPIALENLKETALQNLNQCLLDSLDALTSNWDYVDSCSTSTCTPVVTPSTCPNGDSGLGMSSILDKSTEKINGHTTPAVAESANPPLAELEDDELPERLI